MKRKFRKGNPITSIDEIFQHEYLIVEYGIGRRRTVHVQFLLSQQFRTVKSFVDNGRVFAALRLTNGEFYEGKSDEWLKEKLEDCLCDYCPLPDEAKGVHCYGGQPVMCEGSHCVEALEVWKEELVE